MAPEVIKKDGKREPFDAEKIRKAIIAAAQAVNLSEERKNEIVGHMERAVSQMMEGKEEIATSEIKEKILLELDRIEPSVSAAWRRYEEEKKKAA